MSEVNNDKNFLDNCLDNKDKKILKKLYPEISDEFVTWLCENGYFTAPASHKFHGAYDGGLYDHSLLVANTLIDLTEKNNLKWQNKRSPAVIGLFHDICKVDLYKHKQQILRTDEGDFLMDIADQLEYRNDILLKGHGDKSVMILASLIQLTEEEVMCIRYHMGAFTDKEEWNYYTRAVRKYPNVLWAHHADMTAAHILGV